MKIIRWFIKNPFKNTQKILSDIYAHTELNSLDLIKKYHENVQFKLINEVLNIYQLENSIINDMIINRTNDLSMCSYELNILATLIKNIEPKKYFEIGTWSGETITRLAKISSDTEMYTLDWKPENVSNLDDKIVNQLIGDTRIFDFSEYYNKIDMMFIDGNHHYKYVKQDSETAFRCVKGGGFIIWHDFFGYETIHLGVIKASLEFLNRHGLTGYWIEGTRFLITKVDGVKK